MAQLGRHRRKIDPSTREAEGALGISYIGPANPAIPEWQAAGLAEPDFGIIRKYRLDRLRAELKKRDFMGCVLYDPLNIRYATDVSNMQVWCLHNFTRYCFVATEGPVVLFDYEQAVHLSNGRHWGLHRGSTSVFSPCAGTPWHIWPGSFWVTGT